MTIEHKWWSQAQAFLSCPKDKKITTLYYALNFNRDHIPMLLPDAYNDPAPGHKQRVHSQFVEKNLLLEKLEPAATHLRTSLQRYFFKKKKKEKKRFFYSWETEGGGQRHRQREKQAPRGDPDAGFRPQTGGSWPELKADTQPLSHPGAPPTVFLIKSKNKKIII